MIIAITYAALFTFITFGIACLTDWLMEATAPCGKAPVKTNDGGRKTYRRFTQQRKIPLNYGNPKLNQQIEIRELPFLC